MDPIVQEPRGVGDVGPQTLTQREQVGEQGFGIDGRIVSSHFQFFKT